MWLCDLPGYDSKSSDAAISLQLVNYLLLLMLMACCDNLSLISTFKT